MTAAADPAATRVVSSMFETGEHPVAVAVPLAELKAKFNSTPLLRKALGAAAGVACLTLVAMFGFGGGHAEEPPTGGTGGGSTHTLVDSDNETPAPTVTQTATATAAPKKPRPGVTETATASPTLPVVPTNTPAPTMAPTKPAPPQPAPAPALEVVDWAFCHLANCPYGDAVLYAGYPIAIGFAFNQAISASVSVEIWFDGEYQYTSNFSASGNGTYFDLLPHANYSGEIELAIYVGGEYLDSLYAFVN